MIESNPRFKKYCQEAAKTFSVPFDYEECHAVICSTRDAKGNLRKIVPSAMTVKSLLMRATYARPFGEREVSVNCNNPRARTIYIYDEAWAAERKALRISAVSA
jgi:hypothetical protein